jgi:hypothetical protein
VQHDLHNTTARDRLYDFWADYPGKVLIIINFFALQQMVVKWQFMTRGEALAHETSGVEH